MESNGLGCTLCKQQGHKAAKCPQLYEEVYGQFSGSKDGGGHDCDEDDKATHSASSPSELGKVEIVVP